MTDWKQDAINSPMADVVRAHTERHEPTVTAANDACLSYHDARTAWEGGDFADWADRNGWPIAIDVATFSRPQNDSQWDRIEDALSDDTWDI
jgi:hypothetical protein